MGEKGRLGEPQGQCAILAESRRKRWKTLDNQMTRGNNKMTPFRMWLFNHNYKTNDQEDDDDHRFWRLLAFSLHRLFVSLSLFVSLYQAFLSVSLASLSLSFFLRL